MTITIRPAAANDYDLLPAIEASAAAAFAAHGLCDVAEMLPTPAAYYRTLPPAGVVQVAVTEAGRVVGFAAGRIVDGNGYLRELAVTAEYQQQGIGKRLVEAIIAWSCASQHSYITLTTFASLPFNGPFYQKLGFEIFEPGAQWPELAKIREEEKRRRLDLQPRVAMRKALST